MLTKKMGFVERRITENVSVVSPILKPNEAAHYLGVSVPTLNKLGVRSVRKGKTRRYRVEDLNDFMSDET